MMFRSNKSIDRYSLARMGGNDNVEKHSELDRDAKRIFDIFVAIMGIVSLAPIILIVCIAIKLDTRGPIFSRQAVYGYKKRAIRLLNFRSVTACPEASRLGSRVTRVGRVLRRTGIDQVPQLVNVLSGEMSIVGPRPNAADHEEFFENHLPLLNGIKPGLTGWAQITQPRGGLRTIEQRLDDDLFYFENWSLLLDIKIILRALLSQKIMFEH